MREPPPIIPYNTFCSAYIHVYPIRKAQLLQQLHKHKCRGNQNKAAEPSRWGKISGGWGSVEKRQTENKAHGDNRLDWVADNRGCGGWRTPTRQKKKQTKNRPRMRWPQDNGPPPPVLFPEERLLGFD